MSEEPTKHLQTKVPEEIHRQAKIEAARTGKNLKDVLAELVKRWLTGEIKLNESPKK